MALQIINSARLPQDTISAEFPMIMLAEPIKELESAGYKAILFIDEHDFGNVIRFGLRLEPILPHAPNQVLMCSEILTKETIRSSHPATLKIMCMHIVSNMMERARKEIANKQMMEAVKTQFGVGITGTYANPPLPTFRAVKSVYRDWDKKKKKIKETKPAKKTKPAGDNFWR